VGVADPNPLVDGTGIDRLLKAGIAVDGPCLRQDCYDLNKEFMDRMKAQATSTA
jgi:pyrimidine deaminase RibD-like protein